MDCQSPCFLSSGFCVNGTSCYREMVEVESGLDSHGLELIDELIDDLEIGEFKVSVFNGIGYDKF